MKVTLVLNITDDEAKALSFASSQQGRGSKISRDLALRDDPMKTPINREGIQAILTHMVNANVNQCLQIFGMACQQHREEQYLVKSITKPGQ